MTVGHVVVTTIAAYLGPTINRLIRGSHDVNGKPRPTYLRKRWPIFERFTLGSLRAQTDQRFGVIVLHDHRLDLRSVAQSPNARWFGRRLRLVGIPPIDFRGTSVATAFWRPRPLEDRAVLSLVGPAHRILISHIDSDDCFVKDHFARIHALTPPLGTRAIIPTKGLVHSEARCAIRRWDDPCPPFYTLIVNRDEVRRGYRPFGGSGHHAEVRKYMPSYVLADRDSYLVNVHGGNDSSTFDRGKPPELTGRTYRQTLTRFGISAQTLQQRSTMP